MNLPNVHIRKLAEMVPQKTLNVKSRKEEVCVIKKNLRRFRKSRSYRHVHHSKLEKNFTYNLFLGYLLFFFVFYFRLKML